MHGLECQSPAVSCADFATLAVVLPETSLLSSVWKQHRVFPMAAVMRLGIIGLMSTAQGRERELEFVSGDNVRFRPAR